MQIKHLLIFRGVLYFINVEYTIRSFIYLLFFFLNRFHLLYLYIRREQKNAFISWTNTGM